MDRWINQDRRIIFIYPLAYHKYSHSVIRNTHLPYTFSSSQNIVISVIYGALQRLSFRVRLVHQEIKDNQVLTDFQLV